ncbi:MAG: hypothetical protein Q8Q42_03900 [Nanoarchaeota archaeon]|nr:hypothetical protein [Nanoarchaeota archaeon]
MNISKKYVYMVSAIIVLLLSLVIVQGKSNVNHWTGDLPVRKCNPVDCTTETVKDGNIEVYCDSGMIPISCGYHIEDDYGNKKAITMQEVHPSYGYLTHQNGCELNWKVPSNHNKANVRVEAYCVPWLQTEE